MKTVWQLLLWATVAGLLDVVALGSEDEPVSITQYFLYTQSNPSESQELINGDVQSVTQSNFDANNPTKIIIHGWNQTSAGSPNPELRSAYLDRGEYNIISVDWMEYAILDYISSRNKVPDVGADVAQFIDFLNEFAGLSFDSLVVIGHSFGAHVAGFSGKYVTRRRLPYIVGLEPANDLFPYDKPDERLCSGDAGYVETITTTGGSMGMFQPIGSASFYPNWGRDQPDCKEYPGATCGHMISILYYAKAIRGYKYTPVYRCDNYTNIVEETGCDTLADSVSIGDPMQILNENGIFYFSTKTEEPFEHN